MQTINKTGIIITVLLAVGLVAYFGVGWFNASLTKSLEEEKSYTRHAMEYHRAHPESGQVLREYSTDLHTGVRNALGRVSYRVGRTGVLRAF